MRHNKFLKFNNGKIFENYSDEEEKTVAEIEWRKNMRSFKELAETFKDLSPCSLTLSK